MTRRLRTEPVKAPERRVLHDDRPSAAVGTSVWPLPGVTRNRRIGRTLWRIAAPAGVAAAVVLLSWSVLGSRVSVYVPPDGAHYLADADALLGDGVRPLRHPPLFPALLAVTRAVAGDVGGFQLAMLASLALLTLALYILLRRWSGRGPSLLGASVGVLLPTTAELLGWGGGATLLGIAWLVLSLAAFETWEAGWRSGGVVAGGALALTALTHPFVFGVALLCIGVRWLSVLIPRRRFNIGWDPLGLKGIASAALPLMPAIVVAAPYYLSLQGGGDFSPRPPRPGGLADLLGWALGSDPLVWLLLMGAILAIVVYGGKGLVIGAATLSGLTIVMATSLAADQSYVSRVAYVIPVIVAGGIAVGAEHLGRSLGDRVQPIARRRALLAGGSVLLVAALGLTSYSSRLERSGTFYQFLEPGDIEGIRALSLRDADGVVATSWRNNEYGTGLSTSWFVEGLAKRSAFGPTVPWLSLVPEQLAAGQDMQRLFAGTEGVENGAVQVTTGPPGVRADPAIQVRSGGFYFPLLFGNSLVNSYPVAFDEASHEIVGQEIHWTARDASGREVLSQVARLDGNDIFIEYELAEEANPGSWSVWLWPAYGVYWNDVRTAAGEVQAREGLTQEDVSFSVSVESGDVVYHPIEERFQMQAIEVRAGDATTLSIVISTEGRALPASVVAFNEKAILERHDVSDVVVWKDTGWRDRFDRSTCYVLEDETTGLLFYRVLESCAGGPS